MSSFYPKRCILLLLLLNILICSINCSGTDTKLERQNNPTPCENETDRLNIDFDAPTLGEDINIKVEDDFEQYHDILCNMQTVLLVAAAVTFLCILLDSIYYINLIREIYSKERITK